MCFVRYMAIIHEKTPLLGVSRRFINCLRLSLAARSACGLSFRFGGLPELCCQFGVVMVLLES